MILIGTYPISHQRPSPLLRFVSVAALNQRNGGFRGGSVGNREHAARTWQIIRLRVRRTDALMEEPYVSFLSTYGYSLSGFPGATKSNMTAKYILRTETGVGSRKTQYEAFGFTVLELRGVE